MILSVRLPCCSDWPCAATGTARTQAASRDNNWLRMTDSPVVFLLRLPDRAARRGRRLSLWDIAVIDRIPWLGHRIQAATHNDDGCRQSVEEGGTAWRLPPPADRRTQRCCQPEPNRAINSPPAFHHQETVDPCPH